MIQSCAAKVHAEKLLAYTHSVSATRPYSKTQEDLVAIYRMCEEIQEDIRMTLQSCNSMYQLEADQPSESVDKRKELAQFDSCLTCMRKSQSSVREVTECADLLLTWYHSRFKNSEKTQFKYNIRSIRDWVAGIVLAFGHSIQNDTKDTFTSNFRSWCSSLLSDHPPNYPLPYNIYQFTKFTDGNKYTSVGLVLWSLLIDAGLYQMNPTSCNFIYFERSYLLDGCRKVNPSLAYWHDSSSETDVAGLRILKLHVSSGGDTL